MRYFKGLGQGLGLTLAVVLFLSLSAGAQVIAPTGTTNRVSSQLVFFYDFDFLANARESRIQITNTSESTPVNIHVQIFQSSNASPGNPATAVLCSEADFNDFLTPQDTHVYYFTDFAPMMRNDPSNPGPVGVNPINTKGFVVITPIDAPGTRNAIAFQHMFGNTTMTDESLNGFSYGIPAMGRDAVSFSTGSVLADGTVLDGINNGYILLQPEVLKTIFLNPTDATAGDLVSISFRDNYDGPFGYVAEPGDAVWTPLIFDLFENPISCSPVPQNCFFDIGLNNVIGQANNLLGNQVLCPGGTGIGWIKVAVSGLDGLENELGLWGWGFVGFDDDTFSIAGGDWMHAEGPSTDPGPPPECTVDTDCAGDEVCSPAGECVECNSDADCTGDEVCSVAGDCVECTSDADCNEGAVCGGTGDCDEADCSDGIDNNDNGLIDCADPDCLGQTGPSGELCEAVESICDDGFDNDANGLIDCVDPSCDLTAACEGGGGGCAIASAASAGTTAANALFILIPLLGIGLRTLIRRREED